MLSLLQLPTANIETELKVVQTMNSQIINRINLQVYIVGDFDASLAAVPPNTTVVSF